MSAKDDKIYAGASDGCLQIWNGKSSGKSIPLHNKAPLNALWLGEKMMMTGGGDKMICVLEQKSLETVTKIKCENMIKDSVHLSICALDVCEDKILVGTLGS